MVSAAISWNLASLTPGSTVIVHVPCGCTDEPAAQAYAKRGDLWCLGEHRLLCGDSTNVKDVLRVMDGEIGAHPFDHAAAP